MSIVGCGLDPFSAWVEQSIFSAVPARFKLSALARQAPDTLSVCLNLALIERDGMASELDCYQCRRVHRVKVVYNRLSGIHSYSCLENGEVTVDCAELELGRINLERLLALISHALGLSTSSLRIRVPRHLFELGVVSGDGARAPWTACLATGLEHDGGMDAVLHSLGAAVGKIPGVVFTTSIVPLATPLPSGHRFARFEEFFGFSETGLQLKKSPPTVAKKQRTVGGNIGRPTTECVALQIAKRLNSDGMEFTTYADAACAILKTWPKISDKRPPARDTVTRHLSKAEQAGDWSRSRK